MDGIHDMGGRQGFGHVRPLTAEPPFAEPWEGKAFALGLLSIRAAGANLHAFRHALERVPPGDYLDDYYDRWLHASQILLADSGILSAEQVAARAARLSGSDVPEPDAAGAAQTGHALGRPGQPAHPGHPARVRRGRPGADRRPAHLGPYQAAWVRRGAGPGP